ncbi:hypothetical protein [Photobacterium damselae]|uniref:hypothetical protein n=1 Tax=Photobacterium damselae TaxID=38293 RepID=UPI002543A0AB
MQSKKSLNQLLKEARSESMNKWIGIIQDETEILSAGETPTEKMTDLIKQIKLVIDLGGNPDESINDLIQSTFNQGIQSGFAKALSKFHNGFITTRKKPNEDFWILHSYSNQYQITAKLPTVDGNTQKITTFIKMSEHGFE